MTAKFPQRMIGEDTVSAQGLGCLGMTSAYTSFGGFNDSESLEVLSRAADLGITFWDTSDMCVLYCYLVSPVDKARCVAMVLTRTRSSSAAGSRRRAVERRSFSRRSLVVIMGRTENMLSAGIGST
jgi:hypothetical protein